MRYALETALLGGRWHHDHDYETREQAERWARFLRDEWEPGERDGRLTNCRIVDLESVAVVTEIR
jgi:hypothetical protein